MIPNTSKENNWGISSSKSVIVNMGFCLKKIIINSMLSLCFLTRVKICPVNMHGYSFNIIFLHASINKTKSLLSWNLNSVEGKQWINKIATIRWGCVLKENKIQWQDSKWMAQWHLREKGSEGHWKGWSLNWDLIVKDLATQRYQGRKHSRHKEKQTPRSWSRKNKHRSSGK